MEGVERGKSQGEYFAIASDEYEKAALGERRSKS